ncbi:MAG: inorganic diphosphatase [Methanobacteriota archaeon]
MRIVVETPKWSFVKYRLEGKEFVKDLVSPFPNLFNYGFVEGTVAEDGMGADAIILGRRLKQGDVVEYPIVGKVKLIDNGKRDDKLIFSDYDGISTLDNWKIRLFYLVYPWFKKFYMFFIYERKYSVKFQCIIVNKIQ